MTFVQYNSLTGDVHSRFPVYPISFLGRDYLEIDSYSGLDAFPENITLVWSSEDNTHPSEYSKLCEQRLSKVLTEGFEKLCTSKVFFPHNPPGSKFSEGGKFCHHFVSYIAFGEDVIKLASDHDDWNDLYQGLPYVEHREFSEADLRRWDVIKMLDSSGECEHVAVYIGNGMYINKHGHGEIYIQNLEGLKKTYASDSLEIVRVRAEFYEKLPEKWSSLAESYKTGLMRDSTSTT